MLPRSDASVFLICLCHFRVVPGMLGEAEPGITWKWPKVVQAGLVQGHPGLQPADEVFPVCTHPS